MVTVSIYFGSGLSALGMNGVYIGEKGNMKKSISIVSKEDRVN